MKLSNTHRFLFESAIYLKKNPARAFRTFCAELARIHTAQAEAPQGNKDSCHKAA